jgi:hypothetical protein
MVRFLHGGGVLSRIVFGESILTNRPPPPPSTCNYACNTLDAISPIRTAILGFF